MKKITDEELALLKERAKVVAKFRGHEDVAQIIEEDIEKYEKSIESSDAKAIEDAKEILLENAGIVEEILTEFDYISALIKQGGKATKEQKDVLLFPKKGVKSNILQIAGGAGTGKTLVLLARLIKEINQMELLNEKRALFLCFNVSLVRYIEKLLRKHFSEAAKSITVINIDKLVKRMMDKKHENALAIDYGGKSLREIINEVAIKYQDHNIGFLNTEEPRNVDWVKDEIFWIESRKDIEFKGDYNKYQEFGRIGRGGEPYNPGKNSKARAAILEILQKYNENLRRNKKYTFPQAVNELLRGADQSGYMLDKSDDPEEKDFETAKYDIIAIDEVQDISIATILLTLTFRKQDAKIFIAGDEGQKIYKRDFKWKQLNDNSSSEFGNVIGHTVTLGENHRNHSEIEQFASVLYDEGATHFDFDKNVVELKQKSRTEVIEKVQLLEKSGGTTCVIVDTQNSASTWKNALENAGLNVERLYQNGDISTSGIYIANIHQVKGLEFDNVIIPDTQMIFDDEEICRNLYYVAFTRPRNFLGVYYQATPNELIRRYYGEFL